MSVQITQSRSQFLRSILVFLLAAASASCASSKSSTNSEDLLPYHVAVASSNTDYYVSETPGDFEEDRLGYDLARFAEAGSSVNLVERIAKELRRKLFSQTTAIDVPSMDSRTERNLELVRRARSIGADLLMTVDEVVFDRSGTQTKAKALNWFWFFTGPLELAFNDRSFRIEATAEVALYDLNRGGLLEALDTDSDPLVPSALVRRFRAKPEWIKTRFIERANGGWDYLKCIVIPSNLLKKDGQRVARQVAEASLDNLAEVLVESISVDADFVSRPTSRGSFYLDINAGPEFDPQIKLDESGDCFELTAYMLLDSDREQGDVPASEIRLASGAVLDGRTDYQVSIEDPVQPESVGQKWIRKVVRARIPVEAAYGGGEGEDIQIDGSLRLIMTTEGNQTESRSWTFRIPDQERRLAANAIEARFGRNEKVAPRAFTYDPASDR